MNGLELAIKHFGSQVKLSKVIPLSQQSISDRLVQGQTLTAEEALIVHKATNGELPKERLRPDLWGEA